MTFQWVHPNGPLNTGGLYNMGDFRPVFRYVSERYNMGTYYYISNANKKSYIIYRTVPFPVTVS